MVHVEKSAAVHSLIDGGTSTRARKSNRQLSAPEITTLSLQRGVRSVVDEPVNVPMDLVDTHTWRQYADARKITRPISEALRHIRLAVLNEKGTLCPTRAAVLLFAEEPNGLLESKCTVRVFHYKGDSIEHSVTTNLIKPPKTAGGPLVDQIRHSVELTVEALAKGVQVGPLGFEIVQKYPLRVIREALTNAIIHRDYRISANIHVRIFDTRIEIESPGGFMSKVSSANIAKIGSRPRNRSLVDHLREFPNPPNLDAGEGVRMMFSVMDRAQLYAPVFLSRPDIEQEAVITLLLNEERPTAWRQVEDYARKPGSVGNTPSFEGFCEPTTASVPQSFCVIGLPLAFFCLWIPKVGRKIGAIGCLELPPIQFNRSYCLFPSTPRFRCHIWSARGGTSPGAMGEVSSIQI